MHHPNQSPSSTAPNNQPGAPAPSTAPANKLSGYNQARQENIPPPISYHHQATQSWQPYGLFPTTAIQPMGPSSVLSAGGGQYHPYPMASYNCTAREGVFATMNGGWAAGGGEGSTASSASANSTSTESTHNSQQVVDGGDAGEVGRPRKRVLFSAAQIRALERSFTTARFINAATRARIAAEIGLEQNQVGGGGSDIERECG